MTEPFKPLYQEANQPAPPKGPPSLDEELDAFEQQYLARFRGREHIGLPQRTIPLLDDKSLGLRGFMLLAAPPSVGKTALGLQLGVDVVRANEDACFVFVSLEMSKHAMMARVVSRFSRLDWSILHFGSTRRPAAAGEALFSREELGQISEAKDVIRMFGSRMLFLESKDFSAGVSASEILRHVRALQERTGTSRAFVLVDYLQVLPAPPDKRSEIEEDRWRIGEMLRLRDCLGGDNNALMVISEARKSRGGEDWGASLSDVMGTARATYSPDAVMLLQPASAEDLGCKNEDDAKKKRDGEGISRLSLHIRKGRDGWSRGVIGLDFHFFTSEFKDAPRRRL